MFCRIYFSRKIIQPRELFISLCDLLKAELRDQRYLERNEYSIEIRLNDDFDELKQKLFPDGFLHFPYTIEIDFQDNFAIDFASEEVSKVLNYLWENKYAAIASCEFENLLPENGGYKSRKIPWV